MKSTTVALALAGSVALAGIAPTGAALAQTAPAPKPPAPAMAPTPPAPQPNPQTPPAPGASAQNAAPAMPSPNGPPEGMIVETPNGFFLVRPGDAAPRKLDLGQGGPGQGAPGMAQAAPPPDDEGMDEGDDEGMQPPPPPHPHHPPRRPMMMDGKGARFRIHTPNLTVGVKCPDDEPIKACVDAISQFMDKVNASGH